MQRRDFVTLIVGAAAAWPLVARAQQAGMPVIGYLMSGSPDRATSLLQAFRQGLQAAGFVEGQNVTIEYRWADGQYDRLSAMAADLVRHKVSVIVATGGPLPALAAKSATDTIPIVFQSGSDPVAQGLVGSISRPGGNLSGVTTMAAELGPKRLELLHEMVPAATAIALLVNPANPSSMNLAKDVQAAADTLGLQIHVLDARTERDLDTAFATLVRLQPGGLAIAPDPFFTGHGEKLAAMTARQMIPTIYQGREFVEAGGLMSFGGSFTESYRQLGVYAGRMLKGEKPADLPVQQATKVELVINLKTAKAFGIAVPMTLLGRADEVIE
jgi:putative tryptophan/tyrosine transport system substrate-binding protein